MDSNDAEQSIRVELAYASSDQQVLLELRLPAGSTVEQVVEASGVYRRFPESELRSSATGIWGRLVERDTIVHDGDRVELYRPLTMDPREARRLRAMDGL